MNAENSTVSRKEHYDSTTIFLHWLTTALVIGLWIAGQQHRVLSARRATTWRAQPAHHSGCRTGRCPPDTVTPAPDWQHEVASGQCRYVGAAAQQMHHLLYALLIAVAIIGVGCVWIRGYSIFNWFAVPTFDPGNKWLRHKSVELHSLLGDLLLVVAGIHSIAAAWHLWQLKDDVLRRMLPRLAVRGRQRRA